MRKSLYYLTFNGVFNNTNGVGTQTKILLEGLFIHKKRLEKLYGEFDLNIISPIFNSDTWGVSNNDINYTNRVLGEIGGKLHYIPYNINISDFWTVENWEAMSYAAATTVLQDAKTIRRALLLRSILLI